MNEKNEKMQLFKKKKNTGMHKTILSAGSKVNGEVLAKRKAMVLRPGNTVLCAARELGQMGIKQFDLLSPPLETASSPDGKAGTPVLKKRETGGWYDVVNPGNPDVPINEKALTKGQAEDFLKDLLDGDLPAEEDEDEVDVTDLEGLDWDALVKVYEGEGGVLEEEEDEDELKAAIAKLRKEK